MAYTAFGVSCTMLAVYICATCLLTYTLLAVYHSIIRNGKRRTTNQTHAKEIKTMRKFFVYLDDGSEAD